MKTTLIVLIAALRLIESSNGATSRNELQIQPICIEDVNRIYGTKYKQIDKYDKRRSEEIALLYLDYWGHKKFAEPTVENYARIWNGGPNGNNKESTKKYWLKVKKVLDDGKK